MAIRNYTTSDVLFLLADDALSTLYGKPRNASRQNPSIGLPETSSLSASEKAESEQLMRVNHSGEVCAQALYRGQALISKSPSTKKHMIQAAREESDHLQWCQEQIEALGGKPSLLNPVWYAGSFLIGSVAAVMGDRWSLGFVAETERQVECHLENHLKRLPENDIASRAIVRQMKEDESHHATTAIEKGGRELPSAVKDLMQLGSRIMTGFSRWV